MKMPFYVRVAPGVMITGALGIHLGACHPDLSFGDVLANIMPVAVGIGLYWAFVKEWVEDHLGEKK